VISLLNKFRVWTKGWNMKKNIILLLTALLLLPTVMQARDTIGDYSIKETLNLGKVKSKLGSGVKFYFGDQEHPKVLKDFGEFRTSKKTSSFMKSDAEACQWVFASALIALRDRAIKEGGNAVINIKSNYGGNLTSSSETFQCGAGAIMAGVALVGTVVKIEE
jgi:uncharacterized protein YbjQ (UPF0145 family)